MSHSKKAALILGAALLTMPNLALSACGEIEPIPTEGIVTSRPYGGESFWYTTSCGQYTTVTKTRSRTTGTGKTRRTYPETYTERKCIQNIQVPHRKAPWWQLCVKRPKGTDYCFNVSEPTWRSYRVGDLWRNI